RNGQRGAGRDRRWTHGGGRTGSQRGKLRRRFATDRAVGPQGQDPRQADQPAPTSLRVRRLGPVLPDPAEHDAPPAIVEESLRGIAETVVERARALRLESVVDV